MQKHRMGSGKLSGKAHGAGKEDGKGYNLISNINTFLKAPIP